MGRRSAEEGGRRGLRYTDGMEPEQHTSVDDAPQNLAEREAAGRWLVAGAVAEYVHAAVVVLAAVRVGIEAVRLGSTARENVAGAVAICLLPAGLVGVCAGVFLWWAVKLMVYRMELRAGWKMKLARVQRDLYLMMLSPVAVLGAMWWFDALDLAEASMSVRWAVGAAVLAETATMGVLLMVMLHVRKVCGGE